MSKMIAEMTVSFQRFLLKAWLLLYNSGLMLTMLAGLVVGLDLVIDHASNGYNESEKVIST